MSSTNTHILPHDVQARLKSARAAAQFLRTLGSSVKDAVLETAASLLLEENETLLAANARDIANLELTASRAFRDRLTLTIDRIGQMAESLRQVAALPDPVGECVESRELPNGLKIRKQRSPLGVIFMIFESRPNVAVESFSLAFKAGNAILLRGGKESTSTTAALYELLDRALVINHVSTKVIWGITDPDRALVLSLLQAKDSIDVVVPRGGDALIDFVTRNSLIPVIKNDRGMCHIYLHEDADPEMACAVVDNAKTQRPGVCNSMETLLVHRSFAPIILLKIYSRLSSKNVQWFGCKETVALLSGLPSVYPASLEAWDTEYLDLKLNCRVVSGFEAAIEHIEVHGSRHSEAIITKSREWARRFQTEIDAAAVYWNASTRFTDGFALGLGGELGISTQKLHVRGPVGLNELTSVRWVIEGEGQVRE